MPSHMPSSFASAAAGQAANRDSRGAGRGEFRGGGDWPRREGRGANGTLTLRRSSTTPHGSSMSQSQQQDTSAPSMNPENTAIQSQQSWQGLDMGASNKYSKDNLLDVYRNQQSLQSNGDVTNLYTGNWDPSHENRSSGRVGWGKTGDSRDNNFGPEVCWDHSGSTQPVGLEEMSTLERTLFSGDVNAPSKPALQNTNKDQNTPGSNTNGRKTSISQGSGGVGSFGIASPTTSRPGTRRRETSDSPFGALASPSATRFSKDDPSPFLRRTNTDSKEIGHDDEPPSATKHSSPFGNLMRSNTASSALGTGPASPWGAAPASASMSPMGTFGSFGMGSSAVPATPGEKRPGFGSMRGESRLAQLMPKESNEDISKAAGSNRAQGAGTWRSRPRTDTDPFADDGVRSGSAALGGAMESSARAFGTDSRSSGDFQRGPESGSEGFGGSDSPLDRRDERDDTGAGNDLQHGHGLGDIPEHAPNTFGGLPRAFTNTAFDGSDRSQTSSAGANKAFPSLGGIGGLSGFGGLGGWPTSSNPIGTPDRERAGFQGAFGSSLFSPMGELQSPSLGGLGAFAAGPSTGTIGRGSKLGSLFPAAMQAQMQGTEPDNAESGEQRQSSAFGAIGRSTFSRDTDSPLRSGRGVFDDVFAGPDSRVPSGTSSGEAQQSSTATAFAQTSGPAPNYQQSQGSSDSASSLPQSQQRTMVMPDRMRWVYLDPQGQVQGPWSGLEMHDWYKASFFTADLSVKKVEDAEFEPLGQLIRRIGNSREPFLVPQIGVPHGLPSTQAPFAATTTASAPQGGSVQPPFAGAFPSFGTTLTAEQQNNLERRKQEEQYLMARQREFLAQQQVNMKQMQMQGGIPTSLHHHSSAHSLQSQPSFGSITSPIGMPQGPLPGVSSFFDTARQPPPSGSMGMPPEYFREDEMARLSLQQDRQTFAGLGPQSLQGQISFPQQDLQREAARREQSRLEDQGNPRLREFEQLRAQHDLEQSIQGLSSEPIGRSQQQQLSQSEQQQLSTPTKEQPEAKPETEPQQLSLTEQVKAASAKHSPAVQQPESPWGKVSTALPMPFPPPQSTTPLPAPTAQRGRTDLAETLNLGTRSRSETPEIGTIPSVAPWAKQENDAARGPSLKEIQEAEAKKAAKIEEAALTARRAAAELELRNQAPVPIAAPGLPTSATWATSGSPTPVTAASPWAKPAALAKAATPSASTASRNTLAAIQKEEELRKQKLAAAAAATAPLGLTTGGKRYADLASKPNPAPVTGGAWSTVGSGGKAKIPTGPAAQAPVPTRTASTSATPVLKAARPVASRSTTTAAPGTSGISAANQEFTKWAKAALQKGGLNSDINVDEFVALLSDFPSEVSIIADSVYANSSLMDGRRFAEEFIRRRKLAEKGIIENPSASVGGFSTAGESKNAGGWSEVAKKGPVNPVKEEPAAGFKVVPGKKKGRK